MSCRLAGAADLPKYARVSILVASVAPHSAVGREVEALAQFGRTLEYSVEERIKVPFLVGDPIMADLLNAHAHCGSYNRQFLHAI